MAKRLTTDDQLATLRRLRTQEPSPANLAELAAVLKTSRLHGMALKGLAELAEKWDARDLAEILAAAAESLSPNALGADANKRDPGCEGKQAALHALVTWEADASALYRSAAKWVQHAPVMNGKIDVAAECRGLAAVGLAQAGTGDADAMALLVDLLADAETTTRVRAAQALGMWRGPEAVPLLRFKALTGDEQAEVIGEALASILRHDPRGQLPFVASFLEKDDEPIVEAAALALGESRLAEALPSLTAALTRIGSHPIRTSLLMAIALLRSDASLTWLLDRLTQSRTQESSDILSALRLYRGDDKVTQRIRQAAAAKGKEAKDIFEELFGR